MNITYFTKDQIKNIEDLKNQYKDLIKKHHPDLGGSNEIMSIVNKEYDFLLKNLDNLAKEDKKIDIEKELNSNFKEIINKIITMSGLKIEICGAWLWLTGNTYEHYKNLKEIGFKWSKTKKAWYWYQGIDEQKFKFRGSKTLNQIRNKFGSSKIETENVKLIGAMA